MRLSKNSLDPKIEKHISRSTFFVTLEVSFLLRRRRRRDKGYERGHPAPRQGALQAPWNPLLKSYPYGLNARAALDACCAFSRFFQVEACACLEMGWARPNDLLNHVP
jgi:hypothetical protein